MKIKNHKEEIMRMTKMLRPFLKKSANPNMPDNPQLQTEIEYASFLMNDLAPLMRRVMYKKVKRFFRYRWKFLIGRLAVLALVIVLAKVAFTNFNRTETVYVQDTPTQVDTCFVYPNDTSMNLRNFLLQIAYNESRYNPMAHRDGAQFWGLYQIGQREREITGYGDIPYDVFMNHPEIQDLCMIEMLKYNKKYMQEYIDKYEGKVIDGILATESGIIALCQIGCGTARRYLDDGRIPVTDEHGNHPRMLLKLGGYDLQLDQVRYSVQDVSISQPIID